MSEQSYPVLITGTMQYLVWVEAESPEEAHASVQHTPHEWVDNETQPIEAWLDAEKNAAETYDFIDLYGSSFMPQHDAHVYVHRAEMQRQKREAERAACTAAGHPDRETYRDGAIWCKGCREYLPVVTTQAAQGGVL